MVQTRRQYSRWVEDRGPDYQSECSDCSQESNQSSNNNDYGNDSDSNEPTHRGPQYGTNDACKRHRQRDDDPYTQVVTSYRRRVPRN